MNSLSGTLLAVKFRHASVMHESRKYFHEFFFFLTVFRFVLFNSKDS